MTRKPIPPGVVSSIRGRWQIPALRLTTHVLLAVAAVSTLAPGRVGRCAGAVAVAIAVTAPLARVAWLVFRWWQERDLPFLLVGLGLLLIVATGGLLAT
jgi:hypothetical protein